MWLTVKKPIVPKILEIKLVNNSKTIYELLYFKSLFEI